MLTLPKDDFEKQKILQIVIKKFQKDKEYNEITVNELIKSCDVDDHAMFRRELINFNYLERDTYKGIYWVKKYELSKEELNKIKINQKKIKDIE